ncbi:MAG: hypothetical protein K6U04_15715 [Armatimonadetes bacterium]|nr:hypothetical protein [Armatimonadota bacterium]
MMVRCSRCGTEVDHDWQVKGICIPCLEFAERRRRKEAARRGKFKGELPGKPLPYWPPPFVEAASDCKKIIRGKELD